MEEDIAEQVPRLDVFRMLGHDRGVALLREREPPVEPCVLRLDHHARARGERAAQRTSGATGPARRDELRRCGVGAGEAVVCQGKCPVELDRALERGHGPGVTTEPEVVFTLQEGLECRPGGTGSRGELRGMGARRLAQEGHEPAGEFIYGGEQSMLARGLGVHAPDRSLPGAAQDCTDADVIARPDDGAGYQQSRTDRPREQVGIATVRGVEIRQRSRQHGAGIDRAQVAGSVERVAQQVDHALVEIVEVAGPAHDECTDGQHVPGQRCGGGRRTRSAARCGRRHARRRGWPGRL